MRRVQATRYVTPLRSGGPNPSAEIVRLVETLVH